MPAPHTSSPAPKAFIEVPISDANQVVELLQKLDSQRNLQQEDSQAKDLKESANFEERHREKVAAWNHDQLYALHRSEVVTAERVARLMDVLAFDPLGDKEYNREKIQELTGLTRGELSNMFTRLESHFQTNYGTYWWPFYGMDGSDFEPARAATWYWLPEEVATLWREIRGSAEFDL